MKGTEKQIAWANDILAPNLAVWNEYVGIAKSDLEEKLAKAKANNRELSIKSHMSALDAINRADEILNGFEDAESVIENRHLINIHVFPHGTPVSSQIKNIATTIVRKLG